MFKAVIERLSGKAALQEEIRILEKQKEIVIAEQIAWQKRCQELELQRASLRDQLKRDASLLASKREEWQRQNTALQEQLDKLFIVIQKDELEREVWQDELRHERERREQMERVNQQLGTRCDDLSLALERTRLLYNGQLEKVKQTDIDKEALQGQLRTASALIERYAEIPLVALASKSMALLAELYEARQKHGSVKAWDTRYLDLKAQHGQIAPVEAVEAKEE